MKNQKKLTCIILSVIMLIATLPIVNVSAKTSGLLTYEIINGSAIITDCDDSISGDLVIPDKLGGYPVTRIGNEAFYLCYELESVEFPDSLVNIGNSAFSYCYKIESITIPDSVTGIGDYAFCVCSGLKSVKFGKGVTSIGEDAFSSCGLTKITIPKNVTSIGSFAFYACHDLLSVTIGSGVRTIGSFAFAHCDGLLSLSIGKKVKSIGSYAFYDCKSIESVDVPESVTDIGEYAFGYYDLDYDDVKLDNFTICGYSDSAAETYANKNNFDFVSTGVHSHKYTSTVTKQATCSSKGTKKYTCTICGYSYTKSIAKKDHTYKTTTVKATTSKNGSSTTKCTKCGSVKSKKTIYKISSVALSSTSYTYNGKTKKPTVTVKDSKGNKLKIDKDYTVKYSTGRKNVGTYTVTVTFKGNYSGSKKLTFKIVPKGTTISKLTAGKSQFTAKWSKQSTQTTGYQLQYSTSSKMTNATTKTYSSASTSSATVKSLKSAKTYYVRVRTYKTVNGNKFYSAWSSVKSVKTK